MYWHLVIILKITWWTHASVSLSIPAYSPVYSIYFIIENIRRVYNFYFRAYYFPLFEFYNVTFDVQYQTIVLVGRHASSRLLFPKLYFLC